MTTPEVLEAPVSTPSAEFTPDVPQVREILAKVESLSASIPLPRATYRIQLHAGFTFSDATRLAPYLAGLGISHVYLSPFLRARSGSQHGYDVVDHSQVNPELGTLDDFRTLAAAMRAEGVGLILDVVPNHMCASNQNVWWLDVLENGPSSRYAAYFDIDWMPLKPDLAYKVLLPVLGEQFGQALESGLLQVAFGDGEFWLQYYEHRYPLAPRSYALILGARVDELRKTLDETDPDLLELLSILTGLRNLPPRTETDPERLEERRRESVIIKRRLHELTQRSPAIADFVAEELRQVNGQPGEPRSFDRLDELLSEQAYRLAYWRVAADEINYRRFFDVNELAAICVEHPEVFDATHAFLFSLLDEGLVDGLRIDHPDGLYDPAGYLSQLQERRFDQLCCQAARDLALPDIDPASETWPVIAAALRQARLAEGLPPDSPLARPLYVVVEKILSHGEEIPDEWPVSGTVGYEFLNHVSGVFVDPAGERPASTTYDRFTGDPLNFDELAYNCKRLIARLSMASELNVLGHRLDRISERNRRTRDFTLNSLMRALQEVTACFSVYRTYVRDQAVLESDRKYIENAVARAKRRNPAIDESIFDFVRDVLLMRTSDNADDVERDMQMRFVGKFQQLTGPIMAKAVEDTAFYRYNRLVSLNEVGGEPKRFGATVAEFHAFNRARLPRYAGGMSATSTHDTKRSEDARTRIHVLSEIPRVWREHAMRWGRWNKRFHREVDGLPAPSRNLEYLYYQTLVGIWPDELPQGPALTALVERMQQYLLKVAREAKTHTSWVNMHEPYERSILAFVEQTLRSAKRNPFLAEVHEFSRRVAIHGRWNSLAQTVLKAASPGVCDIYQGTEMWSLTLVDPDNRREIDYAERMSQLARVREGVASAALSELVASASDGAIKLFVTQCGLAARRDHAELFSQGAYVPLATQGKHADRIVAFARQLGSQVAVAIAPRLTVGLTEFGGPAPVGDLWEDTAVCLPAELLGSNRRLVDVFTSAAHTPATALPLASLLKCFPAALCVAE